MSPRRFQRLLPRYLEAAPSHWEPARPPLAAQGASEGFNCDRSCTGDSTQLPLRKMALKGGLLLRLQISAGYDLITSSLPDMVAISKAIPTGL